MSRRLVRTAFCIGFALLFALSACTPGAAPAATQAPASRETAAQPAASQPTAAPAEKEVTITVWDYYSDPNATPIKPAIPAFEKEYPNIHIQYEIMDWDTAQEKLNVALSGGNPPDLTTVDMTWLPRYASLGALMDLKPYMPDGKLNGVPLQESYSKGALDAMTFDQKIVTLMYDFDVYALYYRADILEQKGIAVPKTWDELLAALKTIGAGDQNKYEAYLDPFHVAQFIYENGGTMLAPDNKKAVFNQPEAVEATRYFTELVTKHQVGVAWTTDMGEDIQGIKDGRIAMFSNGPYYMGLLKSGAPEMAGKWRVAIHPYSKSPSSYLGGTGLAIPSTAKNKDAAWKFAQFLMRPENAVGVYTYAGAAPALVQALNSPEVNKPDAYFGGQKAFDVFLEAMKTAHAFPYVRQWTDIDSYITNALQDITLQGGDVQKALDEAAAKTDEALSK